VSRREYALVALDAQDRESLYREVRDRDPDIWEPACLRLGVVAGSSQDAYTALCDLLISPVRELRLKGLVALRTMAPTRPEEVLSFLSDRIEESRISYDPILLDAAFFVFAALPDQIGQRAVSAYLQDQSEEVRAAAATALPFWPEWPAGTLLRLAQDRSVLVRAGLISALNSLQETSEKSRAIQALSDSHDPHLKILLSELKGHSVAEIEKPAFQPLNETRVREIIRTLPPPPSGVMEFGQSLDDNPASYLEILRAGLDDPGAAFVLLQLAEVCRDSSLGTLFRTWHRILTVESPELPLQVLGVLEGADECEFLEPLRRFIKACAQASCCSSSTDMVTWSCTRQIASAAHSLWNPSTQNNLSISPLAHKWLDRLTKLAAEFQEINLIQLSSLENELSDLKVELEAGCPRPERDILLNVVAGWQDVLQRDTDNMLGVGVPLG